MLKRKREREDEPSPPWTAREDEPAGMEERSNARARIEPALREDGRDDEPPSRMMTMVRAPDEPTMREKGRENELPSKSQKDANVGFQVEKIDGV